MRRQKSKKSFKPLIGLAIFAFALFLIFYSLGIIAKKGNLFNIKDVLITRDYGVSTSKPIDLSYLKGRNIFTVDLKKEERLAMQLFPTCRRIKLIRIIPDKIYADFAMRRPIAYLKLYKYFYVDEDGVLFDCPQGLEQLDMPVISGLDTKIFGPKRGNRYKVKELALALNIIKKLEAKKIKDLQIKRIDISGPANISFLMLICSPQAQTADKADKLPFNVMEVKIGQEYVNDKIDILANLFNQTRNDWDNIKYIDLRFQEPVIKFKDIKEN